MLKTRAFPLSRFTHAAKYCRVLPRVAFNLYGGMCHKFLFAVKCLLQRVLEKLGGRNPSKIPYFIFWPDFIIITTLCLLIAQNVHILPAPGRITSGLHAALVFAHSAFQGLSHLPSPARFMPLSLTPATCPKHFLTTLRLYFQQNADQHDLLIRIHGSPCDSSQLKIFHEKRGLNEQS